jgi:hypothetical protein
MTSVQAEALKAARAHRASRRGNEFMDQMHDVAQDPAWVPTVRQAQAILKFRAWRSAGAPVRRRVVSGGLPTLGGTR